MYKCLRLIFPLTTGLEPLGFGVRFEDLGEHHQQSLLWSAPGIRLYNQFKFCHTEITPRRKAPCTEEEGQGQQLKQRWIGQPEGTRTPPL